MVAPALAGGDSRMGTRRRGWSVDEDGESYPVVVSMQTGKLYVAAGAIRLVEQDRSAKMVPIRTDDEGA